ncbi:hypothetical protein ColTof3_14899 [Colletotrichum tofieldiae]|nr:hypothetical protein ColTof3_08510 [Colletotrichum tofieldiae]GKT67560.1 hypothetical protein ColTof3_14899 [Colletotrichum tofieldiae]
MSWVTNESSFWLFGTEHSWQGLPWDVARERRWTQVEAATCHFGPSQGSQQAAVVGRIPPLGQEQFPAHQFT